MTSNDEGEEQETIIEEEEIIHYIQDADTTCTLCFAEFLDPDDLKIHMAQVHKIITTVLRKCHFCSEEYTDLMDYAEHLRDFHVASLKCCSKCWRVFDDFDQHRRHCKKHIINKSNASYSCSQCKQRYADVFLLKQHEFEHKSNLEGVLLHEVLPYLSAALKVKSTTFLEAMDTDVVYICVGCEFSTVDINTYLRHARSNECHVHVCHTCGSVFKFKRYLIRHFLSPCNFFGVKEKKTKLCTDCNTYINVRMYNKHKIHCKPIKCYTCDIIFPTMNDWSEHQSKEHAGMAVEVETCKYCWKRCVGSVAMKKHIEKSHKPELHLYKYLCIYCKSVFKHPQKLFGHFFSKHKQITPYTCRICNKTFHFRKKFTIHIKMVHKSIGYVEFDEQYHVFFTDKKSENPFIPKSIYAIENQDNEDKNQNESENSANVELNSDFINATETEGNQTEAGNQTEVESKTKSKLKRKRTSNENKDDSATPIILDSSDDDEPLLAVRKRVRLQKRRSTTKKKHLKNSNKALLTCNICNKYCYTFQNYNHHISLHSKHEVKKCIKCCKIFKSKSKLNEHIAKEHSSSKLTETLKTLLEKRKSGSTLASDLPQSVKFSRTIKKVNVEPLSTCAKITVVDQKLSVQKFFENFVPEENSKSDMIDSMATIKIVTGYPREPKIKMTKFKPTPISTSQKLSMPVKFSDPPQEKVLFTVTLVEQPTSEEKHEYYSDHYDDGNDMDRHDAIPEVAEEIMLEGTEETPKQPPNEIGHKLVLPKLPSEITDIRIAHLLPQAPYYRIVKVKDVLVQNQEEKNTSAMPISLPDGTKLVTTNPLAHLLGKEHEKVLESVKNKYYKPRNQNLQAMLAKALTMLDKPSAPKRRKIKNTEGLSDDNN